MKWLTLLFALAYVPPSFAGNGFRAHCQDRDGQRRLCRLRFTGTAVEIHRDAFNPPEAIAYRDITRVNAVGAGAAGAASSGAVAAPMPSGVPSPVASGSVYLSLPPSRTGTEASAFALYYVDSTREPHALLITVSATDAPGLAAQFEALTGRSVSSSPSSP